MAEPVVLRPGEATRGISEALPAGDFYGAGRDVDHEIRCWRCHQKLAEFAGRPWRFHCRRCKALVQSPGAEAVGTPRTAETSSSAP